MDGCDKPHSEKSCKITAAIRCGTNEDLNLPQETIGVITPEVINWRCLQMVE